MPSSLSVWICCITIRLHTAPRPWVTGLQHPGKDLVTGEIREPSGANSSLPCRANSAQIGLVEPYDPGLAERDTELLFEHRLEHRAGYLISVDEDAARHAGVQRLQKVPGALRGYDDALLQVPALQLAIGGGVQGDPQRPRERFSAELEEGYLCTAIFLFHAERVVLLIRHARSSPLICSRIVPLCDTPCRPTGQDTPAARRPVLRHVGSLDAADAASGHRLTRQPIGVPLFLATSLLADLVHQKEIHATKVPDGFLCQFRGTLGASERSSRSCQGSGHTA